MTQLSTLDKYFWKYKWLFFLGILFVILTNYFRILAPQLTGYVVNTVIHAIQAGSLENEAVYSHSYSNYDFIVRKVIQNFNNHPNNKILFTGLILILVAVISGFFMFLFDNFFAFDFVFLEIPFLFLLFPFFFLFIQITYLV